LIKRKFNLIILDMMWEKWFVAWIGDIPPWRKFLLSFEMKIDSENED